MDLLNRLSLAALALVAAQCVPSLESGLSRIEAPRVLAVQVTPAEVAPGATVSLRALIAAPTEGAAPVSVRWWRCDARRALADSASVSPSCTGPTASAPGLSAIGEGESTEFVVPTDACSRFGPDPPPAQPGEPVGRPVDPDPTGGYFVPVRVSIGGAVDAVAEVRLRCSLAGAPPAAVVAFNRGDRGNENTSISSVEASIDGAIARTVEDALEVPSGARVRWTVRWPACPTVASCGDGVCDAEDDARVCASDCAPVRRCPGAERYVYFDRASRAVVTRRESIRVAFYSTSGAFRDERVGRAEGDLETFVDNEWTAPSASGEHRLWFVLRDARGGTAWRAIAVRVTR